MSNYVTFRSPCSSRVQPPCVVPGGGEGAKEDGRLELKKMERRMGASPPEDRGGLVSLGMLKRIKVDGKEDRGGWDIGLMGMVRRIEGD